LNAITIFFGVMFLIGTISIASPYAAYSTTATSCTASLDGAQEVPPVDTDGTGSATIELDPTSNELSWSIEFSGLSGPAGAAHFHGPAAAGANAGVQVNIGEVSGLVSPMEGSAELTPEQADALLEGLLYINIHTEANPDGEVRGQVSCESPPAPDGESDQTATLVIADQEFDIQYKITGATLDELTADPGLATLLVTISSTSDGIITIWLPTEVIDADNEFTVFVDGESATFTELNPTADARVLEIEFEEGAEEVGIAGTSIVPEFGSLALLVVSVAIIGAIVATRRFHNFGGLRI
jgi:predicted secreted protein with PEFG-CTERM motif